MTDFIDHLTKIVLKHQDLQQHLNDTIIGSAKYIKIAKEIAEMLPIIDQIKQYQNIAKEIDDLSTIIADQNEIEIKQLAEEEMLKLQQDLPQLLTQIKISLLPKDETDNKNAIVEVRAGTGGEEAALFALQLFSMYQKYAELRKWRFEILSIADTGIGGCKEASALISGMGVFARLKFESGVHRVQRIPETESNGRIHTSAATVAVLPEAEEVDVQIDDKDIKLETCRASGAGGQHVNTTDSAVRIVHIPTGITVIQQDERSQHKNKAKALKILRSRVYEFERQKVEQERSSNRKQQVGSGDRSERIRTYNFPQGRITDHRINLTLHKIHNIFYEGKLDELLDTLISYDQAQKLNSAKSET